MNDYKNVFIFSFSLLIYVKSNKQRVILNVLLVHTWQSARIINYRNPQATFYTSCTLNTGVRTPSNTRSRGEDPHCNGLLNQGEDVLAEGGTRASAENFLGGNSHEEFFKA